LALGSPRPSLAATPRLGMEAQDREENFLSKFKDTRHNDKGAGVAKWEEEDVIDEDEDVGFPPPPARSGEMALPGSWDKPLCQECGNDEGEEGGGRYGVDDHEGLFFCGRCWQAWEGPAKENIMKPAWQQRKKVQSQAQRHACACGAVFVADAAFCHKCGRRRLEDEDRGGNFFDQYEGGEGTDDAEGAWDPSQLDDRRDGDMALPGSWDRPICEECGNDEGEEGGGRYGHGPDQEKFFCGRCWKSWDEDSKKKMMRAYAPSSRGLGGFMEPFILHCPPPEVPDLQPFDEEYLFQGGWEEEEEETQEGGEWEGDEWEGGEEDEEAGEWEEALEEWREEREAAEAEAEAEAPRAATAAAAESARKAAGGAPVRPGVEAEEGDEDDDAEDAD